MAQNNPKIRNNRFAKLQQRFNTEQIAKSKITKNKQDYNL